MKPTDQQQAICKRVRSGDRLFIEAYAGCGKTTTLKLAAPGTAPGLAIAFNKRAATQLSQALTSSWKCSTFNALGMQVIFRSGIKPKLREDKLLTLAEDMGIPRKATRDTVAVARAARIFGIVPRVKGVPRISGLTPDNEESWKDAMVFAQAPEADLEIARALLVRSIKTAFAEGLIDFDDQIYLSALFLGSWPTYPTVMVDEAQDLAPLNIRQLERLRASDAQLIAVGDRHQSIYGWRGAQDNAVDYLAERFGLSTAPLSITFRCPKNVVARWTEDIPGFAAAPDNPHGEIHTLDELPDLEYDHVVLSSSNAPLLRMALPLALEGRPVRFVGRDFIPSIAWLHKAADGCLDSAMRIISARISKLEALGGDAAPQREIKEIYRLLHETFGAADLIRRAEAILTGKSGPTFSTIYRAKGLEWPTVHLLLDEEVFTDYKLRYVGETRTQNVLNLIPYEDK